MSACIQVEVVYALPDEQRVLQVVVPEGTTVRAAIELSEILMYYPAIDLSVVKVGIFGELVTLEQVLTHQQRVEIYRPLIADPKALRQKRAQKAVAEGRAHGVTGARKRD
jgi:uncharacterized protein